MKNQLNPCYFTDTIFFFNFSRVVFPLNSKNTCQIQNPIKINPNIPSGIEKIIIMITITFEVLSLLYSLFPALISFLFLDLFSLLLLLFCKFYNVINPQSSTHIVIAVARIIEQATKVKKNL